MPIKQHPVRLFLLRRLELRRFGFQPLLALAGLLVAGMTLAEPPASAQDLRPFVARYQVKFYGLTGGVLQLTLRRGDAPNEYVYESHADPSFLGGFFISSSARESCVLRVVDGQIHPLHFVSDDGKSGDEKDSNIVYDWEHDKLQGRSERVDFDQPLPPRIQDHLSIQIAVILALQRGTELGQYSLIDAGEIKQFTYRRDGAGVVVYQGRVLDATVVSSQRTTDPLDQPGARITRYWHVPELGNLPARAERSRDGKIDLKMELLDVQFPTN